MGPSVDALTPRQTALLRAVCREYLLHGGDIPSAALVGSFDCSSATIRAEFAVLERAGLVARLYRSAGARPTLAGLQWYVHALPAGAAAAEVQRAVDTSLGVGASAEQAVRGVVQVLAEVAGCVAVSFFGSTSPSPVAQLEVIALTPPRALVVIAHAHGGARVHAIEVGQFAEHAEDLELDLRRLQERLRSLCVGRTLEQAHAELSALKCEHEWRVDRLLAEALRVGLAVFGGITLDPLWMFVAGQWSLAHELSGGAGLREVLARLEDDRRLADILCQLLPLHENGNPRAGVVFGSASLLDPTAPGPNAELSDDALRLALVGCRWPPDGAGRTGAVAVLGGDRLDYASVIPLVEYAARAICVRNNA